MVAKRIPKPNSLEWLEWKFPSEDSARKLLERNSFVLRRALKAFLSRRIGIVCAARRANVGFLLKDAQLLGQWGH